MSGPAVRREEVLSLKRPEFWAAAWREAHERATAGRKPVIDDRAFWDAVADSYGKYTKEKGGGRVKAVMDFLQAKGVLERSAGLLDIGAGSGIHTLPLAAHVREV
ncbi:MAG TPA: hypothetical protein EYP63_03355, partial [Desulfotomaculum sp.]|nr:hypothetical protein [Desulfotomaculum sp.]